MERWWCRAQGQESIHKQELAPIQVPGSLVQVPEIVLGERVLDSKVVTVPVGLGLVRLA